MFVSHEGQNFSDGIPLEQSTLLLSIHQKKKKMTTSITAFVEALEQELLVVEQSDSNNVEKYKLCIACIQQTLIALNEYITLHPLEDLKEKIRLHKSILPEVNAQLIYFIKVYQLETALPDSALFARKKQYQKLLKSINHFFTYNKKLYRYYKSGESHLDDRLFSDAPLQLELALEEYSFVPDDSIGSCQSSRLARLIAYERLQVHLHKALNKLSGNKTASYTANTTNNGSLQWTEQKASLIELAYALHSRGCMNNGKLSIKQVIELFEQIFQINLGNFYRVFQGQRIRKNRTTFLDNLKESLVKKMDDADEADR